MFDSQRTFHQGLCWLLACLMFASPSGPLLAQRHAVPRIEDDGTGHEVGASDQVLIADPVEPEFDLTYMLPDACLVVSINSSQLLSSRFLSMYPIEVLQAAGIQQTGIDPLKVEHVLFSMEPPAAGPPNYAVVTSHSERIVGKLHEQLLEHTQPGEHAGRPHFASQQPLMPSIYHPDDRTIVATPEMTLRKFLQGNSVAADNPLADGLIKSKGDDLYAAFDLKPLRPLIHGVLMQQQVPDELRPFLAAPDLISKVVLRLNLTRPGTSELVVEANNSAAAEQLLGILDHAVGLVKSEAEVEIARLKADSDPVQQAMGSYHERIIRHYEELLMPKREGHQLVIFRYEGEADETTMLTTTAVTGVLVALLLPAVQAAREAARRNVSMNNMKQLMLSLLNYEATNRRFPSYASPDEEGKPLLSWRVSILPYLEEQELYGQFRLDEPWDSEHNIALVSKMPEVFLDPSSGMSATEGKTHYLAVKGKGFAMDGSTRGKTIAAFRDGTSNTIMLVQVGNDQAVTWTKPEDWEPDTENTLKGLTGTFHPGIFLAAFADGSVRVISDDIDEDVFKGMLTIAGGEVNVLGR